MTISQLRLSDLPRRFFEGMMRRVSCRWGFHDWRDTNYPEWQYYDIASYAGTKRCRRCSAFRYWTSEEEAAWFQDLPPSRRMW